MKFNSDNINFSLKTLDKSNGDSFYINLYNKKIKFNINELTYKWVSEYKRNIKPQSDDLLKKFNHADPKSFLIIFYIYKYILPDFNFIYNLLPNKNDKVLEIGSGIGFFANILYQLFDGDIELNLVEVIKNEDHCSNFRNDDDENFREEQKKYSIHTLEYLKDFITLNKIKANIFSPNELRKSNISNINYIYSFRSYCFLYEIEEYSTFLRSAMAPDSKIICDVSKSLLQVEKFKKEFFYKKTLGENDYFERIFAMKNFM